MIERDPVPRELAARLRAARARGEPFETAWATAVDDALEHARSRLAARSWRDALTATASEWRGAYERQPATPVARGALAVLRHHQAMGGSAIDLPARRARYIA